MPHLGSLQLRELNPEKVQIFYDDMLKQGSSKHQVHCIHKVLRVSMNHAVKMGYISKNPCSGTIPPKPIQSEMSFYDVTQVHKLLSTALEISDRFYPLYYIAIHTGMRQAELIGLKWEDIDFDRHTVQISRQVLHFRGEGYTFAEPKSRKGRRSIILGNKALEVLSLHQATVESLRLAAGDKWVELDLVFPSEIGTPVTGSNIRRAFRKLLASSGLPKIRFHDLRHTAASLMLNHGIPVLIVSQRLGHSKASITLDVYGHIMPNKQEEAAQLLDNLISPP